MNVHIITATTLKGRAREGKGGYILALDKDGEINDQNTRREIIEIANRTAAGAEIYIITKAVKRITRPVDLHIWTNNGVIYGAIKNKWLSAWARNGYRSAGGEVIKNAADWETLKNSLADIGIDLNNIICHFNEDNPYSKYLKWEIQREADKSDK